MSNKETAMQNIKDLENLAHLLETRKRSGYWLPRDERVYENVDGLSAYCEHTILQMTLLKNSNVEVLPVGFSVFSTSNILHLCYYEKILPQSKTNAESALKTLFDAYGKHRRYKRILLICCIIFALAFISNIFLLPGILAFIGAMIVIFLMNNSGSDYFAAKKKYLTELNEYKKDIESFHSCEKLNSGAFGRLETQSENALALMRDYWSVYTELYEYYQDSYAKNKAEYMAAGEAIAADTTLAPEHYYLIPELIAVLKSGRADDLKEAINLVIQEEREEKRERQRQIEEERRTAAIDRQTAEQSRHNRELERQNAAHNSEMESIGKQSAAAALAAASASSYASAQDRREKIKKDQDDRQAHTAGMHQCSKCANRNSCPSDSRHQNRGTCGAFRPR